MVKNENTLGKLFIATLEHINIKHLRLTIDLQAYEFSSLNIKNFQFHKKSNALDSKQKWKSSFFQNYSPHQIWIDLQELSKQPTKSVYTRHIFSWNIVWTPRLKKTNDKKGGPRTLNLWCAMTFDQRIKSDFSSLFDHSPVAPQRLSRYFHWNKYFSPLLFKFLILIRR